MAVNATHPDFDAAALEWSRARDVLAGEDGVKSGGEKYLPRLDCQTDEEFAAYRKRASFFNATARTADGYVGLMFRRPPFVQAPESSSGEPSPSERVRRKSSSGLWKKMRSATQREGVRAQLGATRGFGVGLVRTKCAVPVVSRLPQRPLTGGLLVFVFSFWFFAGNRGAMIVLVRPPTQTLNPHPSTLNSQPL